MFRGLFSAQGSCWRVLKEPSCKQLLKLQLYFNSVFECPLIHGPVNTFLFRIKAKDWVFFPFLHRKVPALHLPHCAETPRVVESLTDVTVPFFANDLCAIKPGLHFQMLLLSESSFLSAGGQRSRFWFSVFSIQRWPCGYRACEAFWKWIALCKLLLQTEPDYML